MKEFDDCCMCRYEWVEFMESMSSLDLRRLSKRIPGQLYMLLLADGVWIFDKSDWNAGLHSYEELDYTK